MSHNAGFAGCRFCAETTPPWHKKAVGPLLAHGYCSDHCFHLCVKDQFHDVRDVAKKTRDNFNFVADWISDVQRENDELRKYVDCLEDRIRRLEQNNDYKHRRKEVVKSYSSVFYHFCHLSRKVLEMCL